MDLLERYLQAVRTHLPKSQQDDIVRELSENLRSQMEDKESELGRPLSPDELAATLKRHGHPLVVALRYRQTRHLIGATLFPFYWFVMKIILAIVGFGYGVAALVMIAQGQSIGGVLGAIFGYASAVLPTFGWVTIIFAALDIGNSRFRLVERATEECNKKFDPFSLPKVQPESPEAKPIPRSKTAFELFFTIAFLLWWMRINPIRRLALFIALGPVGLSDKIPFQFGPVWNTLYIPVILCTVVVIARQIVALVYPDRVIFHSAAMLLTNSFNLVILYILARSNEMLVMSPYVHDASQLLEPLHIVNQVLHYTMFFTMALTAIECFKQLWRLIRLYHGPAVSPAL